MQTPRRYAPMGGSFAPVWVAGFTWNRWQTSAVYAYKIRLSGIDAPERGPPYGTASRDHLAGLVAGKTVTVETTKTDRYGRQIGKVLVNGVDANLEQVKAGMAWWYRYYKQEQPRPDRMAYEAAEDDAREDRRGLWADSNPISPYEWRQGKR